MIIDDKPSMSNQCGEDSFINPISEVEPDAKGEAANVEVNEKNE
jgi:hypothetical protein